MMRTQPHRLDNPLLHYYRAIEDASSAMLDAARRQAWDEVVRLESACTVLIGQLRLAGRDQSLAQDEQRAKSAIMRRILDNDAQIRVLAEPWLQDLEHLLQAQMRQPH